MRGTFLQSARLAILLFSVGIVFGCAASINSTNPVTRLKAVQRINDQTILARVALKDEYWRVRQVAVKKVEDQIVVAKVALEDSVWAVRATATVNLTDQKVLARVALEDTDLEVREAAVKRLTDQTILARVVLENEALRLVAVERQQTVWEHHRSYFQNLSEDSLAVFAEYAKDPAVALAAKIRLEEINWPQAYTQPDWSNFIGAAALMDTPGPPKHMVLAGCRILIRREDYSRLPEMRSLLFKYGDKSLALNYVNSGRYELGVAAQRWAREHGYNITWR